MSRPTGTCRLCLETRPLASSHFLPKAFFKLIRDPDNPRHAFVGQKWSGETTKQLRSFLLCDGCEERFNSGGENWVQTNCFDTAVGFPLRNALQQNKPVAEFEGTVFYAGVSTPGVDIDKLVYFAASILWRAAVHDWPYMKEIISRIHLGKRYEEEFRCFLLEQGPFPSNAALHIQVEAQDTPLAAASVPNGGRTDQGFFQYTFHIPGIAFIFALGQKLPSNIHLICGVRSLQKLRFVTPRVDQMVISKALALMYPAP